MEFTTSIINIQTAHCSIPEDNYHHTHHPENLQSYQTVFIFRDETTLKQILIIAALFRMLCSVMPSEWQTNQQFKDHSLLNDHHVKRSIHKPKCQFSKKRETQCMCVHYTMFAFDMSIKSQSGEQPSTTKAWSFIKWDQTCHRVSTKRDYAAHRLPQ